MKQSCDKVVNFYKQRKNSNSSSALARVSSLFWHLFWHYSDIGRFGCSLSEISEKSELTEHKKIIQKNSGSRLKFCNERMEITTGEPWKPEELRKTGSKNFSYWNKQVEIREIFFLKKIFTKKTVKSRWTIHIERHTTGKAVQKPSIFTFLMAFIHQNSLFWRTTQFSILKFFKKSSVISD